MTAFRLAAYVPGVLAVCTFAVIWDLPELWIVAGFLTAPMALAWLGRRRRSTHLHLALDCVAVGAVAVLAGLPPLVMAYFWAADVTAAYVLHPRRRANVVFATAAVLTVVTYRAPESWVLPTGSPRQEAIGAAVAVTLGFLTFYSQLQLVAWLVKDRLDLESRLVAESEERLRLQREFTSMISHELRSPLTSIRGFASLLRDGSFESEERREIYAMIDFEAANLGSLVDDVLTLFQFEAGYLEVVDGRVDLLEVVEAVVSSHRRIDDQHFFAVDVDPGIQVRGDPVRVGQIVRNLVGNAVKYGGRTIEVGATLQADGMALAVVDDGPGVPKDVEESLFATYARGAHAVGGFGLGLNISRRMAEAMGGRLEYSRGTPGGARFTLILPAHVENLVVPV